MSKERTIESLELPKIYIYIFIYLYVHISYEFSHQHVEYINSVRLLGHHTCACYVDRTPYYLNGHDSDKVAYKHFGQDEGSPYKLSSISLAQEGLGLTVSSVQGSQNEALVSKTFQSVGLVSKASL
jgi:hypothetical protein